MTKEESWAKKTSIYIGSHKHLSDEWLATIRSHLDKEPDARPTARKKIDTFLARQRYKRGWSRNEALKYLAKAGSLFSKTTFSCYEHGDTMPSAKTIKAFSKVYGVSEDRLILHLKSDLNPDVKAHQLVTGDRLIRLDKLLFDALDLFDYNIVLLHKNLRLHGSSVSETALRHWTMGKIAIKEADYRPTIKALNTVIRVQKHNHIY